MRGLFAPLCAFAIAFALTYSGSLKPARATVNLQINKSIVLGDGHTTQFSFNFIGVAAAYISVVYTDAGGNQTVLIQGSGTTQYQLVLNAPVQGAIWGLGGTVTYNPSGTPIAAGTTLTIYRTLPLTQAITLQNLASIATLGKGAETGLDTGVMQGQQINEHIGRAIVANIANTTPPLPLPPAAQMANQGLCGDGTGNNIIACTLPATGSISSAMQPVVNAATLPLGRAAFGLGAIATQGIGSGLETDGAGNVRVNTLPIAVASNQTVDQTYDLKRYAATGPISFTLPRANTLFPGFGFYVWALPGAATNAVTFVIDSNDSVVGQASGVSFVIPPGSSVYIYTDAGTAGVWYYDRLTTAQPTVTRLTSGAGTYTRPLGATRLRVQMSAGAGGGGAAGGTPTNASNGTASSFGAWTVNPGTAGSATNTPPPGPAGLGGSGGTNGIGTLISRISGSTGNSGTVGAPSVTGTGGSGGSGPFGSIGGNNNAGTPNTGAGGGGASSSAASVGGAGGGGGGEGVVFYITSPAATYPYVVGAGGAGGGGSGANPGSTGGSGIIVVEEFYG
ncbi:hypothetical protein DW352_05175 [Pseudolabrys taiwanensis]|uniref:Uncharacterized protein n=1 Tax=Pseudolabrys taiwanensis TaxID=331696 RepID=A0A345ZSR4_9HYPH|nr:hypothetical protein [Pseudolabrys taiwanensis]AXK79961.1 hypothetical protein DW352_05175 [Pseudolabrys taiwanensis]